MTSAEWLACTDPAAMLDFLGNLPSDRKLRLFACACCRRVDHLLCSRTLAGVEVAEAFADGAADVAALAAACAEAESSGQAIFQAWNDQDTPDPETGALLEAAALAVWYACWTFSPDYPNDAARGAAAAVVKSRATDPATQAEERRQQADLLRCLFDYPAETRRLPLATVNPLWLAWADGTVPKLAQAIYAERAFDRLPILADALEDAGCADAELLAHLRGPGPHARGCWALDLVLDRE